MTGTASPELLEVFTPALGRTEKMQLQEGNRVARVDAG